MIVTHLASARPMVGLLMMVGFLVGGCRGETEVPASDRTISEVAPPEEMDCLDGDAFVANGALPVESDASDGGPRRIDTIGWASHDGCERLVIDISGADAPTGEAPQRSASMPATPGAVRAELLRDLGILRIELPDAVSVDTAATEEFFEGPLARSAYSVIATDGQGFFIDVHLGSAAEARVTTLARPARIVADLRLGGDPVPPPAVASRRVVVIQPRGAEATYPFELMGYARTFEGNVVARIEQEGRQVVERFTTSTGWLEAWGFYSITFQDGAAGPVELHVGEYSARDGTWEGASLQLIVQ